MLQATPGWCGLRSSARVPVPFSEDVRIFPFTSKPSRARNACKIAALRLQSTMVSQHRRLAPQACILLYLRSSGLLYLRSSGHLLFVSISRTRTFSIRTPIADRGSRDCTLSANLSCTWEYLKLYPSHRIALCVFILHRTKNRSAQVRLERAHPKCLLARKSFAVVVWRRI